jgi:hypothetical protein
MPRCRDTRPGPGAGERRAGKDASSFMVLFPGLVISGCARAAARARPAMVPAPTPCARRAMRDRQGRPGRVAIAPAHRARAARASAGRVICAARLIRTRNISPSLSCRVASSVGFAASLKLVFGEFHASRTRNAVKHRTRQIRVVVRPSARRDLQIAQQTPKSLAVGVVLLPAGEVADVPLASQQPRPGFLRRQHRVAAGYE